MASTGSYERGDSPRSVPDPLDARMRQMEASQRAYNEQQARQLATAEKGHFDQHPGLAESLIPVWGSAREAYADYREGDYLGATVNGVLAASDLLPGVFAVKGLAKGAIKGGSHTWGATRKWMGRKGHLASRQHGHHGIIPRGGWGRLVPDSIKNQPWNITELSPEVHGRIHGRYKGQPQFGPVERYVRGNPNWAKAAHTNVVARPVAAGDSQAERRRRP